MPQLWPIKILHFSFSHQICIIVKITRIYNRKRRFDKAYSSHPPCLGLRPVPPRVHSNRRNISSVGRPKIRSVTEAFKVNTVD